MSEAGVEVPMLPASPQAPPLEQTHSLGQDRGLLLTPLVWEQ